MHAALQRADPAQPIASCPGWTARELTAHLIGVHRWARAALDSESPPPYDETPVAGELADAYLQAGEAVLEGLRNRPAEAPAWTFDRNNRTAGFWRRRQLHEVAMHRWDVRPYAFADDVALDGIDEVVSFMLPRQVAAGRITLPDGTLHFVTPVRSWAAGTGEPHATIEGSPGEVLLRLWGRAEPLPGRWAETRVTP